MKREPQGVPTGGQFSTDARAEPDVELVTEYVRSADRPDADTWQHPARVDRFDAITAYDDEERTATIGDDMHVKMSWSMDKYWVDGARSDLAQLHRAGTNGDVLVSLRGRGSSFEDDWDFRYTSPSGTRVFADINHTGVSRHLVISSSYGTTRNAVVTAKTGEEFDQQEVDDAVLSAVRDNAIQAAWNDFEKAVSGPGASVQSRLHSTPQGRRLSMLTGKSDYVAQYDNDDKLVSFEHFRDYQPAAGDPYASLARAMKISGGKAAGAPDKVREAIASVVRVDDTPDVQALLAARTTQV